MAADNPRFIDVAKQSGAHGREDFQEGWHNFVGKFFNHTSILDVGAGLCLSKKRLEQNGSNFVTLQDLGSGLKVDISTPISEIASKSYDVVTAFDVIEHVIEDKQFLADMFRIARVAIVITTPNYNVSGCANQYHIREYTPQELYDLVKYDADYYTIYLYGSSHGESIYKDNIQGFLNHNYPHHGFIAFKENGK